MSCLRQYTCTNQLRVPALAHYTKVYPAYGPSACFALDTGVRQRLRRLRAGVWYHEVLGLGVSLPSLEDITFNVLVGHPSPVAIVAGANAWVPVVAVAVAVVAVAVVAVAGVAVPAVAVAPAWCCASSKRRRCPCSRRANGRRTWRRCCSTASGW